MARPEFATSRTVVLWDMDDCPLPNGYEPCRLGPRIDTELKSVGYNGELIIIAVGNLEGIPYDFLKALSSGGDVIKHSSFGIFDEVVSFFLSPGSQPPISIMLISTIVSLRESVTRNIYMRDISGYNLLLAYPPNSEPEDPHPSSLVFVGGEWLWGRDSLLKDSGSETRRLDTGCEQFSCKSCRQFFPSFEDFKVHLETNEHTNRVRLGASMRGLKYVLAAKNFEARKQSKNYLKLVDGQKLTFQRLHEFLTFDGKKKASNLEFQKEEAQSSLAKKNPTAKEKEAKNFGG
ncbi:zinc finger protein-related [Raphanus sativus]|nr:zinc finger protein-related [Raphanus sativus]